MAHKLFPSQQPNEKIYVAVREHWFLLFIRYFFILILVVLPLVFAWFLRDYITEQTETIKLVISLLAHIYYIGILVAVFIIFVLYYLNLHIVSDMRVVDIDQRGLLKHEVSELNLETVEDVTSDTVGLFGNILNYGTVYVQTAGTVERFEFENVPYPSRIANIILTLYERQRRLSSAPKIP